MSPVQIHGNTYITVAERVQALHDATEKGDRIAIVTGIHSEDETQVTCFARVETTKGTFHGHARSSKANRSIEGQSPLEVAETSAIGRALGFAGFGLVEGIATADEVRLATHPVKEPEGAPKDTPAKAALRKLYALAKEKGMDEGALKEFLVTDSLKALAQHMVGPMGDCAMAHPHGLKDEAEGYRTMIRWLEAAK
jgi:hypothetical protein